MKSLLKDLQKEDFFKQVIHFEILSENNVNFASLNFSIQELDIGFEQDFKVKLDSDVFKDCYLEFSTKIPIQCSSKREPKWDYLQAEYVNKLKNEIKELQEKEEQTRQLVHLLAEENLESWKKHQSILIEERKDFGRELRLLYEKHAKEKKDILEKDSKIIQYESEEIQHEKEEIQKLENEKKSLIEKLTKNMNDLQTKEDEIHDIQIKNEKEHYKVDELNQQLQSITNSLEESKRQNENFIATLKEISQKMDDYKKKIEDKDKEIEKLKQENELLKKREFENLKQEDSKNDDIIHFLDIKNEKSEELNLSTLKLNEQNFKFVLDQILKNRTITKLDISQHNFNNNMINSLCNFIENTNILELSIRDCEYDKNDVSKLKESLMKNKTIVEFTPSKMESTTDVKEIESIMERNFQLSIKKL